ncbi:MAG TPA: DUF4331 domain-containing protein [Solirubrobacteraceae bacterium]|nr:DUF4331 domain-containing protein [Solirubrobacteraceae bacterium]
MSSHREAPEISKDPVADNTDTYAFVSPDKPDTVTIITNYLPAEAPAGGPTFYEFGNDVAYTIHVDNNGDGVADIEYQFTFESKIENQNTFLYNTGPIRSLTDPNWSKRQFYRVQRRVGVNTVVLAEGLACPPSNIGPRSTPNYAGLANEAIHSLQGGVSVFAGQRNDPFFVDIGSIFDLADLRPFQNLHILPEPATAGTDTLATLNVHSIAIQVPIKSLVAPGANPAEVMSPKSVLGIWGSASRRAVRIAGENEERLESGPYVQVSRLANPLVNEVLIPMARKDAWNGSTPSQENQFKQYFERPELAALLPVLYPEAFPKLAAFKGPRNDLVAILGTGIPSGVIPGFQNASRKGVFADMMRLNVAIPPTKEPNKYGILGGDLAGYPNGRRVTDDATSISLRAVAGATLPLVESSFTPDGAANLLEQGLDPLPIRAQGTFPYVGTPHSGFDEPSETS